MTFDPKKTFTTLGAANPYFNMGFRGEPGGGKTYTASVFGIGIYEHLKCSKGIIVADTEESTKFLTPLFQASKCIDVETQVFYMTNPSATDLFGALDWMDAGNADMIIIDSVTTIHKRWVEAYRISKRGQSGRLQISDWDYLKTNWAKSFSDKVVHGKGHVMICGRVGNIYDYVANDGGKKDAPTFVKTGTKMRGDTDTPYEMDLYMEMRKHESLGKHDKAGAEIPDKVWRSATVLKSRFPKLDGCVLNQDGQYKGPRFADILPAVDFVANSGVKGAEKSVSTPDDHSKAGGIIADNDAKERSIWMDRIMAELNLLVLKNTDDYKLKRTGICQRCFDSEASWRAVAQLGWSAMKAGLEKMQALDRMEFRDAPPDVDVNADLEEKGRTPDMFDGANDDSHLHDSPSS